MLLTEDSYRLQETKVQTTYKQTSTTSMKNYEKNDILAPVTTNAMPSAPIHIHIENPYVPVTVKLINTSRQRWGMKRSCNPYYNGILFKIGPRWHQAPGSNEVIENN